MDITKLARDSRSNYRRDLGWEFRGDKYQQHRFYLGQDKAEAMVRVARLERLWSMIEARWTRTTEGIRRREQMNAELYEDKLTDTITGTLWERPLWDRLTLTIALAIARGEETVQVDPALDGVRPTRDGPEVTADWWTGLLQDYGGVGIRLVPLSSAADTVEDSLEEKQGRLQHEINFCKSSVPSKQTLHQALDAYSEYIGQTMLVPDGSGRMSPTAKLWQRQIRQIKAQVKDILLSNLDNHAIEAVITKWKNRPVMPRTKRPASPETAKDTIKRIRTFIRWLHKAKDWAWRKPEDYEVSRVSIRLTPEEMSARKTPLRVPTFTLDELCTLYEYASPWERLSLLLGLNCAFNVDQISMLQVEDIHLDGVHAEHGTIGPWIGRVRFKTGVYGEWTLWPQTVQAIEWMSRRRGDSQEAAFILNNKGVPLKLSKGSNRSSAVPNAWNILLNRVEKDKFPFRRLSFGKVKKTAVDWIRKAKGGEIARVFSSRGHVVSDVQIERYSNRDFLEVFRGIEAFGKYLEPMFATVSDPFPADMKKHNPSVTPGQIKRMVALRQQGYTLKKIGDILGLCDETVRRYLATTKF